MVVRVGSLGSCRVRVPLKIAAESGRIRHLAPRGMAYAHNPLEIIQGIRLLKGEIKGPDPAIASLTAVPHEIDETRSYDRTLGKADVVVCELSSIRIVQLGRWQLQLNCFQNHFRSQSLSDRFVFATGRKSARTLLECSTPQVVKDRFTRKLLQYGSCYEMDSKEIRNAVETLIHLIDKPILFVCAFVPRSPLGAFPQRIILRDAIRSVAEKHPEVALFDPSVFVSENPSRTVFRDYGHFADDFIPVVADRLASEAEALWDRVVSRRIKATDPVYMLTGVE